MNEIKLKPCPFCGGKAHFANRYVHGRWYRTVFCEKCSAAITNFEGRDDEKATEIWNRRADNG